VLDDEQAENSDGDVKGKYFLYNSYNATIKTVQLYNFAKNPYKLLVDLLLCMCVDSPKQDEELE
jgi:hypothetical protein